MASTSQLFNLTGLLSVSATLLSVAQFASLWKTMADTQKQITQNDKLGILNGPLESRLSQVPLLTLSVNCLLWWTYSVVVHNATVFAVNCIGFILSVYYNWWYFRLATNKDKAVINSAFALVAYILSLGSVMFFSAPENATSNLGAVCAGASIAAMGAPLSKLGQVIKTGSSESIPKLYALLGFCAALCWVLFGLNIGDVFVVVPNCISLLLTSLQLLLICVYRNKKPSGLLLLHRDNSPA